jgi:hypothetical protein
MMRESSFFLGNYWVDENLAVEIWNSVTCWKMVVGCKIKPHKQPTFQTTYMLKSELMLCIIFIWMLRKILQKSCTFASYEVEILKTTFFQTWSWNSWNPSLPKFSFNMHIFIIIIIIIIIWLLQPNSGPGLPSLLPPPRLRLGFCNNNLFTGLDC